VRTRALSFFLDNVSVKYSDYDPYNFRDLAFVPAVLGLEKALAKPLEVRDLVPLPFSSIQTTLGSCTLALSGQH
jgi:hypothetical protein